LTSYHCGGVLSVDMTRDLKWSRTTNIHKALLVTKRVFFKDFIKILKMLPPLFLHIWWEGRKEKPIYFKGQKQKYLEVKIKKIKAACKF